MKPVISGAGREMTILVVLERGRSGEEESGRQMNQCELDSLDMSSYFCVTQNSNHRILWKYKKKRRRIKHQLSTLLP